MRQEPQGELARYAFGYSDKKPSLTWWIIQSIMVAVSLASCTSIQPTKEPEFSCGLAAMPCHMDPTPPSRPEDAPEGE